MTNIIKKIDSWGESIPDSPCFIEQGKSYTYLELKETSDRIAANLLGQNLPEGPIAVYGENNFAALATFLGCVKSGHCYIPIDAHTPMERVQTILSVSEPVTLIVLSPIDFTSEFNTLYFEDLNQENHLANDDLYVDGDENFYIIYTSGTTGVPKGVQISHDNLNSFVQWMRTDFDLSEQLRYLSQAPFSFDLSVMSIYPALYSGSTLMALSKDETIQYKRLFETLPTLDLNVWVSTPSFMDICLMDRNFTSENYPSLTTFLFCGEELTHKTATTLKTRFPKAVIWNTYGPTEATVAITKVEITDEILANNPRLPIGIAKSDVEIQILDEQGAVLPPQEIGEINLIGASVSKGYFKNEERTTEAFYLNEGRRAYRTGDLGYLTADGQLFYSGRKDFQVKLNGYRIEIQDIESHLLQVPYVQQAIVIPEVQDFKVKRLTAVVVPTEHDFEKEFLLTKAIQQDLRNHVMDYMVPARFIYMDQFPLTQNGKIDRKAIEGGVL